MPRADRRRFVAWAAWTAIATLAFARPLYRLMVLASNDSLHSHIPLVPFVAAYLLFVNRETLPHPGSGSTAGGIALGGISLAAAFWAASGLSGANRVSIMTVAYLSLVGAGGFLFFGMRWMAAAAFPMAFLLFIVPLPDAAVVWMEDALVLASADVSAWMIRATGTPMIRDGTIFALPTITLEVARECSGIRSTWVLFITSMVASQMFLKSPWRRFILVAFVIPLGIVRNGFRILTIALLCVNVGPHMVDSVIHHRGGPIFFALSLVPLFLLMTWLRRTEPRA